MPRLVVTSVTSARLYGRANHYREGKRIMAAKRGRTPGFTMSDEHRLKIQNSNILKALIRHCEGTREMSASQVAAGLGLLRKVMPDLAAMQVSGDGANPITTVRRIERVIVAGPADDAADTDAESIPTAH